MARADSTGWSVVLAPWLVGVVVGGVTTVCAVCLAMILSISVMAVVAVW